MDFSKTDSRVAVAVIGAGAFGRNHARVYHELEKQGESVRLAAVVDADQKRARAIAEEFGTKSFDSVQQMLAESPVRAASVAVPTVAHLSVASQLMEAGVDVLIEKPLASTLQEADALIRIAQKTGRIAQVGHLERFNPAVQAVLPLVTQPMFFEVHRLSVFSPRSLDIDVVLDLMIHDLDVVLSVVNSPVKEIRAVGLPILSSKVDIANVRLEFESGCVANFTASRVSTERVRKVRFFQPRQYVSIDYSRQDAMVFTVTPSDNPAGLPQIGMVKPTTRQEEPLRAEITAFLKAVQERGKTVVTLEDGRRALEIGLKILAVIASHHNRAGLGELGVLPAYGV